MTDKYHLDQPLVITMVTSSSNAVGNLQVLLFSHTGVGTTRYSRLCCSNTDIPRSISYRFSSKRGTARSLYQAPPPPPSGFVVAVLFDINFALWCNDNICLIYLLWKALINTLFAFCWLVEALRRHAAVALVTSFTPVNWVYTNWYADHESQF